MKISAVVVVCFALIAIGCQTPEGGLHNYSGQLNRDPLNGQPPPGMSSPPGYKPGATPPPAPPWGDNLRPGAPN